MRLSLAAMADVKILLREDIQQKVNMYCFKLMSTMCEGGYYWNGMTARVQLNVDV